jgi:tripartite ATP-independent transporter DctM subunit
MNVALAISLAAFLLLAVPVGVSLILASAFSIHFFTPQPLLVVAQKVFASLDSFPLLAVPLFILSGNLMSGGGISDRLVDLAKSLVGNIRGGLPVSCVFTCMIFASVSGSSVATTFAIGAILIPAMVKEGYPVGTAAAVQAASAELGALIPPSIPLILYGVATGTSVGQLFLAGVGPGLLVAVGLMTYLIIVSRIRGYGTIKDKLPVSETLPRASAALTMPVVILGGIYGGIFTPTEAAVVAVIYALVVGVVVYRELTVEKIIAALKNTAVASAAILLIIGGAGLFSFLISLSGLPSILSEWIIANVESKITFLLAVNIFLFIIGMFIEGSAAILVLAPLLAPVAISYGINPVHFGLIIVTNLALGMCTPPVGVNLFAACSVAGIPLHRIIGPIIPLVLVIMACVMVVTFVPAVSIGLVDLFY